MPTTDNLLIKKIISSAAERKASDIHLTVGNYPFVRINGQLSALTEIEILKPENLEAMVDFLLSENQKAKFEKDKEVTFIRNDDETSLRFRINIFYQKGYPMISFRIISQTIPEFSSLGLPEVVAGFSEFNRGLVIISGPFSSGRSTTLASLLQLINQKRGEHIITLEKPIEHLFVNEKSIIEQREIGKDVDSFEKALKTILDEDINIVAITGLLSPEAIESALELAESGRLVFLLMNSDSVVSVLDKIIAGFEGAKKNWALGTLSDVLVGILVQRLIPKQTEGLALAFEILTLTPAVKSLLKEGKFHQLSSIMQTSRAEGMVNMDKNLFELVKENVITKETAIRESLDKESFKNLIRDLP